MKTYDILIIGGGLGGLACGAILSREGFDVCVLEQNGVIGGCLQSFTRRGRILDTGIHYIGSMAPGQVLNRYFGYFGILDKVPFRAMDPTGYDIIRIGGKDYRFPTGYEDFGAYLGSEFPREKGNIKGYLELLNRIGGTISPDMLSKGKLSSDGMEYFGRSASEVLDEMIGDPVLREVLAGNSSLYHGIRGGTSLYHYGMINHSFIEGAYRVAGGSQQIADALTCEIRRHGGTVLTGQKVTAIRLTHGKVSSVETESDGTFRAKQFISAIHPSVTFGMLEKTPIIRKAYLSRIRSLRNSYGIFSAYLLLKPETFPYKDSNYYFCMGNDTWNTAFDTATGMPRTILMSMQAPNPPQRYAQVVNLLCPVDISLFSRWTDTSPEHRGDDYRHLKSRIADRLTDIACGKFPGLKERIEHVYTTTPLTYRDYTGIPDGSAYGIIKDSRSPVSTLIPVKTKIPNLLLTGQNMNVHGALGVTLTAALTCAELLGEEYLARKIAQS